MADRSVKVRLTAEIGQYQSALKQAEQVTLRAGAGAQKAGQATDKLGAAAKGAGAALKGTIGDVDKFGNALSAADVAAGRYVNNGGRVVEANGQMAAGFGKARDAAEEAAESTTKAATGFGRLTEVAQQNEQAWGQVSTALMGVGAAAVAGTGLAVKTFADYDQAMSSVQAATHASEADMAALGDAAIKAGADTAYSAEEAAQGIEELAKAGVSTGDILGGGLDGALSLAAAGALEVGDAAEIAASALTQFKLEGSDVGHIADLLAAGAGKAQGSVHDLGMALNQVGLVASGTGLSIEETTGGLAAFASAGLVGSDAGTSFKTMLQRLTPQSEEAAKLMDELGLSAYDSSGEFIGLAAYAGKLQTALGEMSSEQRNATMNTLFGSDAVRAANVLYEQGADGVAEWTSKVNDAGYAAETAALMQDNLAGDLEKLGGAFDTVFLKAGSGPNEALRGLVQGLEGVVDAAGRIPAPVLSTGTAIAGIGGAGLLAVGGMMKMVAMAAEARTALTALGVTSAATQTAMAGIGKSLGVLAVGIAAVQLNNTFAPAATEADELNRAMADLANSTMELDAAFANAEWANDNGGSFANPTIEGINGIGDALAHLHDMNWFERIDQQASEMIGFDTATTAMQEDLASVDEILAQMVSSGNMESAAAGFERIASAAEAQGVPLEVIKESFPEYASALDDAAMASEGAATGSVAVTEGLAGVAEESGAAAASLEDVVDGLSMLGLITLDAQASTGAFHAALRDVAGATDGMTGSIVTATGAFNVTTQAGYAAQQAFANVATSGWDMAEANAAAGGSLQTITGNLQSTYNGLVTTAQQFGFTAEQARTLAREALGIPPEANIDSWMSDAALRMAQATGAELDRIDGRQTTSTHTHYNITRNETYGSVARRPGQAGGIPERAVGGRVPALATGGRLPATGLGRDQILGISSLTGEPTAWVDDLEWVVNRRSSDKFNTVLGMINRDDPRVQGLAGLATGGRINGLSARPGEENWQWQARQLQIIQSMEYTVGKLADWELYEDGSGWVRTMDGAMVQIADGAYTVTYAAGESARSMGLASQDAKWAAETAKAAGGSFQGAGGAAVTASGSFQYAGVTANATAGTFQVAGQVTQQAAQAILAATAAVNAAGKQRKAATGGGLTARAGEADVVWKGRQGQFEQAIAKRYGGVKYSDIYEDGSGQIVLDDGRLIELNNGRWKFVSRFKYGAPAHGRTVSRYANGGRLPSTGLGTDSILGISSAGAPVAWVDDREWVINQRSSDKYNALLGDINRDDPSVRHLARHAAGARAGSREYAAAPAGFAPAATVNVPEIDYGQLAAAMSRVQLSTPPVQIGLRDSKRIVGQAGINR